MQARSRPHQAKRLLLGLVAAATLFLNGISVGLGETIRLPDIGDPADTVLSRSQERQLGAIIAAQIRGNMPVLNDPELNSYIQSLGTRLASAGASLDLDYTFLILQDPSINAFATPGGVVAFHTGLISAAKVESEVAGVMAHEIAHVEQRHMARAYANAKTINLATALGVLAGLAVGMAGGAGAGAAVMQGSMAAGQEAQLAFSRSNEQEADRVGIELLTEARYDPDGMPNFFLRLHEATQLSMGPVPEFLSTHPVTLSRISDTKARADQYKSRNSGPFVEDSEQFHFVKARILALTSTPSTLVQFIEDSKKAGKTLKPADQYAYAIALSRTGQSRRAIKILSNLKVKGDGKIFVQLALTQAYLDSDEPEKAQPIVQRLNEIYPGTEAIVYYLAQSLLAQGRSREAFVLLEKSTVRARHNPILDELKARAAAQSDQPGLSREAMADYYEANGRYDSALLQLEMALRDSQIDSIARARIRSKHKALKDLLEEA